MTPVRMSRLPDSIAPAKAKRPAKVRRSREAMRADLVRALESSTSPLRERLLRRALAQLDREEAPAS